MGRGRPPRARGCRSLATAQRQPVRAPRLDQGVRGHAGRSRERSGDSDPSQLGLLVLQRSVGNRALARLLTSETDPGNLAHAVPRSGGSALAASVRRDYEASYGADFGSVRVHTDAAAASSAKAWRARAYTVGEHIVFARGAFSPGTVAGRRLLAHELAHVVQQRTGQVTGRQLAGTSLRHSEPGDRFERAADQAAAAFLSGGRHLLDGSVLARRSTTGATVVQGAWEASQQAEFTKWRSHNQSNFKTVSMAQLAQFCLVALRKVGLPENKWNTAMSPKPEKVSTETESDQQPYLVNYQLQVSFGQKKSWFQKVLDKIRFANDYGSDVSGDFSTGGVNPAGLSLDTAHHFMMVGASKIANSRLKKTVKKEASKGGVHDVTIGPHLGMPYKLVFDLYTWQIGSSNRLVLGDIEFSLNSISLPGNQVNNQLLGLRGVIEVRNGALSDVKKEELSNAYLTNHGTWLSAVKDDPSRAFWLV